MAQLPLSQALSSPLQATQVTTAASNSTKPCNQWPVALQAFTKTLEVTSLGQGATQHLCQWTRTWEIYGNLHQGTFGVDFLEPTCCVTCTWKKKQVWLSTLEV